MRIFAQGCGSFVDEFIKLSQHKQYNLPLAAHELGHAQIYERSKLPKSVRDNLPGITRLGTLTGALGAAGAGSPVGAGVLTAVGELPTLIEEGRASLRGLKALREEGKITPQEYGASKKFLGKAFGTYAARSLGTVGALSSLGIWDKYPGAATLLSLSSAGLGVAGSSLLKKSLSKDIKHLPMGDLRRTEQLRDRMGVTAGIAPINLSAAAKRRLTKDEIASFGAYIRPGRDAAGYLKILTGLKGKERKSAAEKGAIVL